MHGTAVPPSKAGLGPHRRRHFTAAVICADRNWFGVAEVTRLLLFQCVWLGNSVRVFDRCILPANLHFSNLIEVPKSFKYVTWMGTCIFRLTYCIQSGGEKACFDKGMKKCLLEEWQLKFNLILLLQLCRKTYPAPLHRSNVVFQCWGTVLQLIVNFVTKLFCWLVCCCEWGWQLRQPQQFIKLFADLQVLLFWGEKATP